MATIGQIVYNVQDYHASGGYISTAKGNPSQTVSSKDINYDSLKVDIFKTNLTSLFSGSFSKLGIQAPPGTKAVINDKIIMIGRTGTYELDQDISVTSLHFIRPYKYILDQEATDEALDLGEKGFEEAEKTRKQSLQALDAEYPDKGGDDEDKKKQYWAKYREIQDTYEEAYNAALANYIPGVNGIYKLPYPGEERDENYEEVYNVIIDFMY